VTVVRVTDIVPTTRVRMAGGCRVVHVEAEETLYAGHADLVFLRFFLLFRNGRI